MERRLGRTVCDAVGEDRDELGVVPRDMSGEQGGGDRGGYIVVMGGSLHGPASCWCLREGSLRSESSGSKRG